ncbi:hypothetical protein EJ02DRAFT_468327 [Clathrospora elynae]|uniref:Uncharacterized protein n=1 Tax=Clathrospora elynae TaxID=706981 RepID=A0A6A5SH84_9PLEO|nr:hypothetical protein EJ02DRAFT_468327 [Clathrospora elynae]
MRNTPPDHFFAPAHPSGRAPRHKAKKSSTVHTPCPGTKITIFTQRPEPKQQLESHLQQRRERMYGTQILTLGVSVSPLPNNASDTARWARVSGIRGPEFQIQSAMEPKLKRTRRAPAEMQDITPSLSPTSLPPDSSVPASNVQKSLVPKPTKDEDANWTADETIDLNEVSESEIPDEGKDWVEVEDDLGEDDYEVIKAEYPSESNGIDPRRGKRY